MTPAKPGRAALRLARTLAELRQPLYVLDRNAAVLFANRSLADLVGLSVEELQALPCRYQSATGPARTELVAAALAPPPSAFVGRRAEARIWLPSQTDETSTSAIEALVRFVPLELGDDEYLVLGLVERPRGATNALGDSTADEAAGLHAQLQQWRAEQIRGPQFARLVGVSPKIARARQQLELAVASGANVLIVAPAGAQPQLIAREIHTRSGATRMLPLDAPRADAESIRSLFAGSPHAAEPGSPSSTTLLCFDVDQLTLDAQAELEAALTARVMSLRVISTAARPLEPAVRAGAFRPQLACLLSTLAIRIPPLGQRIDDLPLTAQALVEELNSAGGKQLGGFSPEALDELADHRWPGDIAELADVVGEAWEAAPGPQITVGDLPRHLLKLLEHDDTPSSRLPRIELEPFLAAVETELLRRALALAKGNKTKAAKMLGMTRPRLYRRLVQCGLEQPAAAEDEPIDWLEEPLDESDAGSSED